MGVRLNNITKVPITKTVTSTVSVENVYGMILPSDENQKIDTMYAIDVAERININYDIVNIKDAVQGFEKSSLNSRNLLMRQSSTFSMTPNFPVRMLVKAIVGILF